MPTTVLTALAIATRLIALLQQSTSSRSPSASSASAHGLLKRASAPCPSRQRAVDFLRRHHTLPKFDTKKWPMEATTTLYGLL